ncbi:MAG TPA: hypothetical protein VK742_18695 [Candidatus Sulfotelmatobacter sp.]|jgi:hypothetical protein|nr:hypothetical protein [Candidatus Sulfotelmatobacter sp.]
MSRTLFCLSLLVIAPLVNFLGNYLGGAGILPAGFGFLAGASSMFLLPWAAAFLFSAILKAKPSIRVLFFAAAMVLQGVLLFTIVPPGATCEMMGIAHRLGHEFSVDELRNCAMHFRQKFHDGTLKVGPLDKDNYFIVAQDAEVVSDTELPDSLRGRFQRVFIQKSPVTGEVQVVFSIGSTTGIVCDSRTHVREFFVCSMADGVQAYRYQRL